VRLGLVVNPVAGLGGRVGLKGSDGLYVQQRARTLGAIPQATARATTALQELRTRLAPTATLVLTAGGAMGEEAVRKVGLKPEVVYGPGEPSSAGDTVAAARALAGQVDLLLFAGGDGTARDVLDAVGTSVPVLGIPTGVKMHSAVFAVNPRAAGEIAAKGFRSLREAEVMDLDEEAVRQGRVSARLYGYLNIPDVPLRIQQRKTGSSAVSPEAVSGIAADLAERLAPGELLVLGPGTTTRSIAAALNAQVPVMGVNVLSKDGLVAADVDADGLLGLVAADPAHIAVTPIGGQGFLLGRGNQQLSPEVLRSVGLDRLLVVATEAKLAALGGRPLLVDTGDDVLDRAFPPYARVLTGHHRTTLYPIRKEPNDRLDG
jgi:predicted polyphosphate/ATP-dependent NAD kinase